MKIKDFIPPILIRLLKKFKGSEEIIEYENYSQAMQACTTDAYQNIVLCNMIADKTIIHVQRLTKKPFKLNPTNVFLLSAINQYINAYSKNDLKILDFGGACGAHYFELKRFIPKDVKIIWYVLETEQMVKSAIDRGLSSAELYFISSINEIRKDIDFIHSSCTLHYVPNPYEFINMLINIKANWMFFNRMMFNENDRDFITVQKSLLSSNGPGKLPHGYLDRTISYPHTTLSFQKFNSTFLNNDYRLEWEFEESTGTHRINDEKIVGKGLLYIRK